MHGHAMAQAATPLQSHTRRARPLRGGAAPRRLPRMLSVPLTRPPVSAPDETVPGQKHVIFMQRGAVASRHGRGGQRASL